MESSAHNQPLPLSHDSPVSEYSVRSNDTEGNKRGPALRLYGSSSQAYREIIGGSMKIQKGNLEEPFSKIRRSNQSLVLWARDFEVAEGGLDLTISKSERLRGLVLKNLTEVNRSLIRGQSQLQNHRRCYYCYTE